MCLGPLSDLVLNRACQARFGKHAGGQNATANSPRRTACQRVYEEKFTPTGLGLAAAVKKVANLGSRELLSVTLFAVLKTLGTWIVEFFISPLSFKSRDRREVWFLIYRLIARSYGLHSRQNGRENSLPAVGERCKLRCHVQRRRPERDRISKRVRFTPVTSIAPTTRILVSVLAKRQRNAKRQRRRRGNGSGYYRISSKLFPAFSGQHPARKAPGET